MDKKFLEYRLETLEKRLNYIEKVHNDLLNFFIMQNTNVQQHGEAEVKDSESLKKVSKSAKDTRNIKGIESLSLQRRSTTIL